MEGMVAFANQTRSFMVRLNHLISIQGYSDISHFYT